MDIETATATPRSPASVTVRMRGHTLVQDKPAPNGADEGPMASELLLASLLACQHSTFVKVAAKRRVEARVVAIEGEMGFRDGDIASLRVVFTLESAASGPAIETCLRLTDKACTISQALKVPVEASFRTAA